MDDGVYKGFSQLIEEKGAYFPLSLSVDIKELKQQVGSLSEQWRRYNPRKPEIKRYGMSLTSLDGGTKGVPDLDSVFQYNALNDTGYRETDFRELTDIYQQLSALHKPFEMFLEDIGRSHLIKLDAGGHFPPHRDDYRIDEYFCFRLICPLWNCEPDEFSFIFEDNPIYLKPGQVWFVNVCQKHSVFSFCDDSVQLVMNIRLSKESLKTLVSVS